MYKPIKIDDVDIVCNCQDCGYEDDSLIHMIKLWIKFLENEAGKTITDYPRGMWQAAILKEIFDLGDEE